MRKVNFIIFFFLTFSYSFFAQDSTYQAPNYNEIEKNISDENSSFYYPILLEKFFNFEDSLSMEDYHNLYFGYIFQENYSPYSTTNQFDSLNLFYDEEILFEENLDLFISVANRSLVEFPLDITTLNALSYAHFLKGDTVLAHTISERAYSLADIILMSGDGLTCESSWHVIRVSDEYTILNIFEMEMISQSLIGDCDYLEFELLKYAVDGFYFNISKLLERNLKIMMSKNK